MKDRYKLKVYLTKESFEEIAIFDDIYPNLNHIFRESATFILDMTDDELDRALEDLESGFAIFCNSYNIKTIAKSSILDSLINNKDDLIQNCRSLFIMDINEQEASEVQKETGVLVLSKDNIDDNIFNQKFWRHHFTKGAAMEGDTIYEWINVLKDMPWLPTNSIVITDNFLLSESNVSLKDCVENVKGLLEAILPDNLDTDFHILISTRHPDCSESKRNKIVGEIKSHLSSKKSYGIKLEIIFHDTIHQRKIITNYNVMIGDKGFVNFSNTRKKIIEDNPTYACSIFQNIRDSIGNTEYEMATIDLERIHSLSEQVKAMNNGGVIDHTKRIVGDCERNKTIINRLISTTI